MPKFLALSKQIVLLLVVIILLSLLELSQATPMVNARSEDMSESAGEKAHHQRRTYELKKLRHFLLTSNAKQLAAKREKANSLKRDSGISSICE
jgi:cytochrome c-type biogenesis protein CcmH/NrfG